MQEKIIIDLSLNAETPAWVIQRADGVIERGVADVTAMAAATADRDVIVIVPAESIVLTKITLPKMNANKLQKAIPFALEDQLVEELEQLHFAVSQQALDGTVHVAIVAKDEMNQWMELLQSWQVLPDVMIPLTYALPLENGWTAAVTSTVTMRTGQDTGFACDSHNLSMCLNLAITESGFVPPRIHLYNTTTKALASSLRVTAAVEETFVRETDWLLFLAKSMSPHIPINLLQSSYIVKKRKFPKMDKLWKTAAYGGAAFVALFFLNPIISYFILQQRVSSLDSQIRVIYKRNFPNATSMVAPKMRLDEKLQKLEAQVGQNRLLILLGNVGKGLQASTNIKIKRLDFQGNALTLEIAAANSDDFSAFTQALEQQGLNVKQQNADLAGSRVSATLQVE